ncbi:unnamed protein product [Rhizoctonia solani]|uniref:Uncharacterized protein n=1 Tax=Rhizoctonia solani TaxID=456999 RepID=A0A8H3HGK0_9AGAM|nr:unnamed protein product [Rhizoctonia solani]
MNPLPNLDALPRSGIVGFGDNMGGAMANFGNGQGRAVDSMVSGAVNAMGALASGATGIATIKTKPFVYDNKPPPKK